MTKQLPLFFSVISICAFASMAKTYKERIPVPADAGSRASARSERCSLGDLPKDFLLYGVGAYEGTGDYEYQLDAKSGHATSLISVIVTEKTKPVVLVLTAYDPVVWKVGTVEGAKLAGVIASGYHRQAVIGISKDLPLLLLTSQKEKINCNAFYAYEAGKDLLEMNQRMKNMVGREIDHFDSAYTGTIFFAGPKPESSDIDASFSSEIQISNYVGNAKPVVGGQTGIENLVKEGVLRRAEEKDISAWVKGASAKFARFNPELKVKHQMGNGSTYVVLKKMTYPTGLFGGNSVNFILPKGVPGPLGNPGHCQIYSMDDFSCRVGQGPHAEICRD